MWQTTCFLKLPSVSSRSPLLPGQLLRILFRDLPPAEQLAQPWYSPFLLLWCQRIDLFWPFPLCQEPPAVPVSTSQISAFLQFCLWPIGFWGDPACRWGICQMSLSQPYLWGDTPGGGWSTCALLYLSRLWHLRSELVGVVLRRAKDPPLSADLFRSTTLSIIFKALSCW